MLQTVVEVGVPHWLHYYFQTKSLKGVADYMVYESLFSVIRSKTLLESRSKAQIILPTHFLVTLVDATQLVSLSLCCSVLEHHCCLRSLVLRQLSSQPPSSPEQPLMYFLTEFPVWMCGVSRMYTSKAFVTPPHPNKALQDGLWLGAKLRSLGDYRVHFFWCAMLWCPFIWSGALAPGTL